MFAPPIIDRAEAVIRRATARGLRLRTAESCTGGLVAGALTAIDGSSSAVDRGFVTYSNEAKSALLGVPAAVIEAHGAVSRETAEAMARGAVAGALDVLAISITGIAGPGGGSPAKPVGLVWFGVALGDRVKTVERRFGVLGRDQVRQAAVEVALDLMLDTLTPPS